jgi:hypothetical protein
MLFANELDQAKYEYDNMKRGIIIPINHGKYSG